MTLIPLTNHARTRAMYDGRKKHYRLVVITALSLIVGLVWLPRLDAQAASPLLVTTTADSRPGSLRQALTDANAQNGDDVITVTATGTINLQSALPDLMSNITINGPGANLLTVRRESGGDYRIFTISSGATVAISGLTISNGRGYLIQTNGPLPQVSKGAGIYNSGTLTLSHCVVSGNSGYGLGGIYNDSGTLTVSSSAISGNTDVGIYNYSGTLTLNDSTISGNTASGIRHYGGRLIVRHSTISGNNAVGVHQEDSRGSVVGEITNSTISGNVSSDGGGIFLQDGTMTITNSTITDNRSTAYAAGGIFARPGVSLNLRNSIVAGNSHFEFPDVRHQGAGITSLGHNLIGKTHGSVGWVASDLTGMIAAPLDAKLGPLQDNGGQTKTHALLSGSPAIDAGDNSVVGPPLNLTTDQRGRLRQFNGTVDIRAYEVTPPSSHVLPITADTCSPTFELQWAASALGSTVTSYSIFVSEDNGPFTPFLQNTTDTFATFTGQFGHTYGFYSLAVGDAGLIEAAPAVADATVTLVKPPPPTFTTVPSALTIYTGADATACAAFVSDAALGNAAAEGICSDVTVTRSGVPSGNLFTVGTTTLTHTATDSLGQQATATQTVTVIDNTPPVISSPSVDKPVLWPPNRKMVDVTVNYAATDNCGPVTTAISGISSNEPINATDAVIVDSHHVRLRAERLGRGTGRIYTIMIKATDSRGNTSQRSVTVRVPHDQGKS